MFNGLKSAWGSFERVIKTFRKQPISSKLVYMHGLATSRLRERRKREGRSQQKPETEKFSGLFGGKS